MLFQLHSNGTYDRHLDIKTLNAHSSLEILSTKLEGLEEDKIYLINVATIDNFGHPEEYV